MLKPYEGRIPTHPGEVLVEDVIPALKISKVQFAQELGVSRQTLYDLLKGKQGVTANIAVRLGKLCGNGPRFWLSLQQNYDLAIAEREVDVSNIRTLEAAE